MRLMRAHIFSRPSSLIAVSIWFDRPLFLCEQSWSWGVCRLPVCFVVDACSGRGRDNVLGLTHAADQLIPAVTHNSAHSEEEDTGTETLRGEVSL